MGPYHIIVEGYGRRSFWGHGRLYFLVSPGWGAERKEPVCPSTPTSIVICEFVAFVRIHVHFCSDCLFKLFDLQASIWRRISLPSTEFQWSIPWSPSQITTRCTVPYWVYPLAFCRILPVYFSLTPYQITSDIFCNLTHGTKPCNAVRSWPHQ